MSKVARRVFAHWPRFFFFTFLLVLLRPQDPLHYLFFLLGFFVPLSHRGQLRPLYLWLGWSFFSALCASEPSSALVAWGEECVVAGAGFAAGLYGRQDRRWLWALQVAGWLMGGMILIQAAAAPPFPRGWVAHAERGVLPFRVTGLWNNPNGTGLFLAYLLPLFLGGMEEKPARGGKIKAYMPMALTGLTVTALLFTYARTAWLAALIALIIYWGPRERVKLRRLIVILLLLVGFFPSVAGRIGPNALTSGTVDYRFTIWQETWRLVQKYPLTGGGEKELRASLRPLRVDHAHNHYLQITAEKGIPAFFLFGWLLFRFRQAACRSGGVGQDSRLLRGVAAAFGGQLVAGLAESIWAVPLGSFLFWFAFALVTAERKPVVAAEGETGKAPVKWQPG
ncbi:MAG: O-antigen ligase family protein [Firmicutes bacterium]|nr:O-antigen ligase family protein [Bacillota bacterium]